MEVTCFRPQVKPYNPKKQLVSWFRLRVERDRFRTAVFLLNTGTMEKDLVNAGSITKKKTIVKNLYVTIKQVYCFGTMRGF